jgi:hypothetical protein
MQFCNFTQEFLLEASNAQYSTATDAYADMAEQKFSGDPKGRTYAVNLEAVRKKLFGDD